MEPQIRDITAEDSQRIKDIGDRALGESSEGLMKQWQGPETKVPSVNETFFSQGLSPGLMGALSRRSGAKAQNEGAKMRADQSLQARNARFERVMNARSLADQEKNYNEQVKQARWAMEQNRKAARGSVLGNILGIAGAVVGSAGGPMGAAAGYQIGQGVGSTIGSQ